ncbi:retrovirus-related pol polyprotein from transposon TNT 1-94 [Tanacetum coccineum]|uniref:Retrovirus-related pol polyprotein from transposon TNT 1-94 n=1 Tax=Tanacetum coccineum TaxID=301880 RepID=A0ABQ5D8Y4_9ASTR
MSAIRTGSVDQDNPDSCGISVKTALYGLKTSSACGRSIVKGFYSSGNSLKEPSYADADHAGCQDTRRSTSGCMQLLGDRLVSWSSKRQKSVAISSTEAEYIAMLVLVLISLDEITAYRLWSWILTKFQCTRDTKRISFCCKMFPNFLDRSILTSDSTLIKSKERIEFLINKLGMRSFTPETLKQLADEAEE